MLWIYCVCDSVAIHVRTCDFILHVLEVATVLLVLQLVGQTHLSQWCLRSCSHLTADSDAFTSSYLHLWVVAAIGLWICSCKSCLHLLLLVHDSTYCQQHSRWAVVVNGKTKLAPGIVVKVSFRIIHKSDLIQLRWNVGGCFPVFMGMLGFFSWVLVP